MSAPGYLLVDAGSERLALAVGAVRCVVPRPSVTRVPFAPARVAGLMGFRGSVIAVVATPGEGPGPRGEPDVVVVLEAEGGKAFALVVRAVGDFVEAPGDARPLDVEAFYRALRSDLAALDAAG